MTVLPASANRDEFFYELEAAVLDAIALQYPTHVHDLRTQFQNAHVISRHNSGAGFFTHFEVARRKAPAVMVLGPIGNVNARLDEIVVPMTFLVFTNDGYAKMLEGALAGDDGTTHIDFSKVQYRLLA